MIMRGSWHTLLEPFNELGLKICVTVFLFEDGDRWIAGIKPVEGEGGIEHDFAVLLGVPHSYIAALGTS